MNITVDRDDDQEESLSFYNMTLTPGVYKYKQEGHKEYTENIVISGGQSGHIVLVYPDGRLNIGKFGGGWESIRFVKTNAVVTIKN